MTAIPMPVLRTSPWSKVKKYALPIIPFFLLIGVWVSVIAIADPAIGILPRPLKVLQVPFQEDEYWPNVTASLGRLFIGFLVAAVTGVLAGIVAGLSRKFADFIGPLVTAMNAISGIAWIPLAIAWFGIGRGMVVFIVWNGAFFLIFANTVLGVRMVPEVLDRSLQTLGASRLHILRNVTFPGALPHVMSGLRSGLGFGWRAVIAAELVGATSGLGQWIFIAQEFARADIIVAGALTIGVIGLTMDRALLAPLERRTIERWGLVESSS
jgi:taurine transport system permease protein